MNKRCTVDSKFDAVVVGVEHDGYLVQEVGTNRVEWFQFKRVQIW